MSCRRPSNASSRVSGPSRPDQREIGVYLDHGQAPSGRGDRVAFPGVRLLPRPQRVHLGLPSGAVGHGWKRGRVTATGCPRQVARFVVHGCRPPVFSWSPTEAPVWTAAPRMRHRVVDHGGRSREPGAARGDHQRRYRRSNCGAFSTPVPVWSSDPQGRIHRDMSPRNRSPGSPVPQGDLRLRAPTTTAGKERTSRHDRAQIATSATSPATVLLHGHAAALGGESRARVSSFSLTSNSSRAAFHSCRETIGGMFIDLLGDRWFKFSSARDEMSSDTPRRSNCRFPDRVKRENRPDREPRDRRCTAERRRASSSRRVRSVGSDPRPIGPIGRPMGRRGAGGLTRPRRAKSPSHGVSRRAEQQPAPGKTCRAVDGSAAASELRAEPSTRQQ